MEVRASLLELDGEGIAGFIIIASTSSAIGVRGLCVLVESIANCITIFSAATEFSGTKNVVSDRGIFACGGRVAIAVERILKTSSIEQAAVAIG